MKFNSTTILNKALFTICWKNFKQRQRKFIITCLFELALPISIILLISYVNKTSKISIQEYELKFDKLPQLARMNRSQCYSEKPLMSAGTLDWLQGVLCIIPVNPCENTSNYEKDYLEQIFKHTLKFLDNPGEAFSKIVCGKKGYFHLDAFNVDYNTMKSCTDAKNMLRNVYLDRFINVFEGTIYYFPINKKMNLIVDKVEEKLKQFTMLKNAAQQWRELYAFQLQKYLALDKAKQEIGKFLTSCIIENTACKAGHLERCQLYLRQCSLLEGYLDRLNEHDWSPFIKLTNLTFALAESLMNCMKVPKFVPAASQSDLFAQAHGNAYSMGLIIEGLSDTTTLQNVGHLKLKVVSGDVSYYFDTREIGTVTMYELLTRSLIEVITGTQIHEGVTLRKLPQPCVLKQLDLSAIYKLLYNLTQVVLVLCWMPGFCFTVISIVDEKQKRLTFTMRLMSVTNVQLWFSWILFAFPMFMILSFSTVFFFDIFGVLKHTSLLLFFLILLLYSFVSMLQSLFLSILFKTVKIAAIASPLLYLFGTVIRYFINDSTLGFFVWISALIPQAAFNIILNNLFHLEFQGKGLTFYSNNFQRKEFGNILQGSISLFTSGCLFTLFILYIEAVFPGEYGIAKVWYFPFTKQFWGIYKKGEKNTKKRVQRKSFMQAYPHFFEDDPKNRKIGIEVTDLVKKYGEHGPIAVDSLSLKFYVDQVTAFLGQNGAGKTTTLSIIAGIFPQTSGEVIINGYNSETNPTMALANLGLCPQNNVLFDYLTVEEHVKLYSGLKQSDLASTAEARKGILDKIGLYEKRNNKISALSGGMKRRLSVGLAFLGNPTAVILDEPTAGVDPFARREIWDVILAHKSGRAIILTTHHMDEADILGDRIAILARGKLRCCGTAMFLKQMLGNGYLLNISLISNKKDYNIEKLKTFINKYVQNSTLTKQTNEEVTFELPRKACDSGEYHKLFKHLEHDKSSLQIESYGLNNTSLETIFLAMIQSDAPENEPGKSMFRKIVDCLNFGKHNQRSNNRTSFILYDWNDSDVTYSDLAEPQGPKHLETNSKHTKITSPVVPESNFKIKNLGINEINSPFAESEFRFNEPKLKGISLWFLQLLAILIKRAVVFFRGIATVAGSYLVPFVFLIFAAILYNKFGKIVPEIQQFVFINKEYHPWSTTNKSKHLHVFFSIENTLDANLARYARLIETPLGLGGVRCMNPKIYQIENFSCHQTIPPSSWVAFKMPKVNSQRCSSTPALHQWPVRKRLATTDYLYKLHKDITELWLLQPDERISHNRHGGFTMGRKSKPSRTGGQIEVVKFFKRVFVNASVPQSQFWNKLDQYLRNGGARADSVTVLWHKDDAPYDTALSYLVILMNLFYRSNTKREMDTGISLQINQTSSIFAEKIAHPFRGFYSEGIITLIKQAFTLAVCSVLFFLVDEKVTVSKYLQIISGIQPALYWLGNFLWDMLHILILMIIMLILFRMVQFWEFIAMKNVFIFVLLFVLFCSASLIMMYALSHFGSSPGKFLLLVFIIIEISTNVAHIFVQLADSYPKDVDDYDMFEKPKKEEKLDGVQKLANFLRVGMIVVPNYNLKVALSSIFEYYHKDNDTKIQEKIPTLLSSVKSELINLFGCLIGYTCILIFLEYSPITFSDVKSLVIRQISIPATNTTVEEIDVAEEKYRVLNDTEMYDVVQVKSLTKVYTKHVCNLFTAVSDVSFGMRAGECFGLLGVNGAGKTTTFKMMTGEIKPTAGNIFVHNGDINRFRSRSKALLRVGYCPQFNGFGEKFTTKEVLMLHARLNGIRRQSMESVVSAYIKAVGLKQYTNNISGELSGGNKRKLSTCIALIGDPDVVFLDEPTSGMDTAARRELWDCIINMVSRGKCVILASHSLEECEVLCHRACIMVSGKLRCLGSIQYLKSRFGRGYTISMSLKRGRSVDALKEYMKNLDQAQLSAEHNDYLEFELPFSVPLSKVFKILQIMKLKKRLINHYSINQNSLDDVFIEFAKTRDNV